MSRSPKKARRARRFPLWGAVAVIAILSAAALALSYVALTGVGSNDHPGLPVRSEIPTAEEAAAPPTQAEPEVAEDQTASSTSQRMLAMVGSTAMRAASGTCETPGTAEISVDAGQNWSESASLAGAGATQILRVLPTDPSLVQVVALDANCDPQVYRSTDLGTTWEGPLSVVGTWYFDPSTPTQVGAPDGPRSLPCEGAELAAAGDRAAVRCAGGSVVTTIDRGITWSEAAGVTDALAINYSPDSYVVAQKGGQACEGVRLTTLGGATSPVLDGCFETTLTADASNPENTAIAQSGTSTLLWVEDDVVISTDGGRMWL
ncbi:hypothetical protein B840_09020 [Corynebacterium marinum DSM 44953]|uniref:Uncharacterized protein n=1 Tax=Corynebacterium marinum DSM 44953 TaxID=1224162 RepID=A0A0B6THI9_9CORY|nr:hypothetical protein B840_09020 [Corynebacterium marinum DSM 44953]GGO21833.1 hypothetical protein GCM10010980_23370 [Corynebacterium marinum]